MVSHAPCDPETPRGPAARGSLGSAKRALLLVILVALTAGMPLPADEPPRYGRMNSLAGSQNHYGSRGYETAPPQFAEPPPRARSWWPKPWLHSNPDDPGRHVGLGEPLVGTSWLNRPYQVGWLVGSLYGDNLNGGRVHQDGGLLGGYRLGWDFDHYWGSEARLAFANLDLSFPQTAAAPGTASNHFLDVSLLYYPWGDARWRPFVSLGLGLANFRYWDDRGARINATAAALPIGLGVKYRWKDWLTLRGDLTNNWSFGAGSVDSMHSVSLTFAAEAHFGGRRKGYFPFDSGR